jgi:hypothetical protein
MPAVQPMLLKHWRSMISQNSYLKEVFDQPPLTAFRRQQNLRNFLIKSKVPPPPDIHQKRFLKGMKKMWQILSHLPICRRRERGSHKQKSEVDIIYKNDM